MDPNTINTRQDLLRYFAASGFKTGAEIGVLNGHFALQMFETIPDLKYFGIDPWYDGENTHHPYFNTEKTARQNLEPLGATLIKKRSQDALADIADNSLDFVYLDGDHRFDAVILDIMGWIRKVKKFGIVAGHDYEARGDVGVIPAVNAYVQSHSLRLNLTREPRESITWWFVKRWNT